MEDACIKIFCILKSKNWESLPIKTPSYHKKNKGNISYICIYVYVYIWFIACKKIDIDSCIYNSFGMLLFINSTQSNT